MAHATGTRAMAYICFIVGLTSVVGIPLLWPIGYWLLKAAKKKEREREKEIELLEDANASV